MSSDDNSLPLKITERKLTKRITINGQYFLIFSLIYGESREEDGDEEYDSRYEFCYEVRDTVTLTTKIHETIDASTLLIIYQQAKHGNSATPIIIAKSSVCELNTLFTGSPHPITLYIPLSGEYGMADLIIEFVETFFDEETLQLALGDSAVGVNTKPTPDMN